MASRYSRSAMSTQQHRPVHPIVRALAHGLARWRLARQARLQTLQLRAMSDRELRDLGIGRSQVPALWVTDIGAGPRNDAIWTNG